MEKTYDELAKDYPWAIPYIPMIKELPNVMWANATWGDTSSILKDIIVRFSIDPKIALEFGVATGHSTSALACYFDNVIGVDTFREDYSYIDPRRPSKLNETKELLKDYNNIHLVEILFEDYIKYDVSERYDLIHIDLIHTYEPTYQCGEWALQHSDVVLFHDTISFPEVRRAVSDLVKKYDREFYNYYTSGATCGLGIVVKK